MNNLSTLGLKLIFFFNTSLRKTRKYVCSSICFTLTIIDLKMVMKELLGSADLTKAQILCIHELLVVIMVSKNENLIFVAF